MSSLSSFADRFAKPPRQPQMKRPVHFHLTASVINIFAAFPLLSSWTVIAAVPTTRQAEIAQAEPELMVAALAGLLSPTKWAVLKRP